MSFISLGLRFKCLIVAIVLSSNMFSLHAETVLEKIRRTGSVTIAHRESSIPFSYYDENKQAVGYAVDICVKLADSIKKELALKSLKVNYLMVTSANRIEAIRTDKADLECGSTTNTAERRKQVAFTIPHYVAGVRLLSRSDSTIRKFEDLRGKTVVTTKGTTAVKILQQKNDQMLLALNVIQAGDHAESFSMVETGKAEMFAMDDVLLYSLRANSKNPNATKVVGDFLSIEPLAIMLKKDEPEFKKLIDREMTRMIVVLEMQTLYAKWFEKPIPPKGINLSLPMSYLTRNSFQYPSDFVPD